MSKEVEQKESSDASYCCSVDVTEIPSSNMFKTTLTIEAGQIVCKEFIDDLGILLNKHCVINNE